MVSWASGYELEFDSARKHESAGKSKWAFIKTGDINIFSLEMHIITLCTKLWAHAQCKGWDISPKEETLTCWWSLMKSQGMDIMRFILWGPWMFVPIGDSFNSVSISLWTNIVQRAILWASIKIDWICYDRMRQWWRTNILLTLKSNVCHSPLNWRFSLCSQERKPRDPKYLSLKQGAITNQEGL